MGILSSGEGIFFPANMKEVWEYKKKWLLYLREKKKKLQFFFLY